MEQGRSGCNAWGCLAFVLGILAGGALATLAIVALGGGAVEIDESPLENRVEPWGTDLAVTVGEAYINQIVAEELATRNIDQVSRIIIDVKPGNVMHSTLEGNINLGGFLIAPRVESDVQLSAQDGQLNIRILRATIGPVTIVRDDMPALAQSLFESVEQTMKAPMNEPIEAQGLTVQHLTSDEQSLSLGLNAR
jgi:hypothetical protein